MQNPENALLKLMVQKSGWLVILLFFPLYASSQTLSLEVLTGASGGWWYYTQGNLDAAFDTEKGNAYTESALILPVETNLRYTIKRFDVGAGMQYSIFAENEMFGLGNTDTDFNKLKISKNAVTFFKIHLLTSYALLQANNYTLSPQLKAGIFTINTTHPDRDNFGSKTFWEAGIRNEISFAKWRLLLSPYFNTMTIRPRQPLHEEARHKIYSLGIMFGAIWPLYKN